MKDKRRERNGYSLNLITKNELIGEGHFGKVYTASINKKKLHIALRCLDKEALCSIYDGSEVAVKEINVLRQNPREVIKEIEAMEKLTVHPNIVDFLGKYEIDGGFCLVLEYCPGGNLEKFLRNVKKQYLASKKSPIKEEGGYIVASPSQTFTMRELLSFAKQVSEGMEFLEDHYIIHRDLAARNCLLTKQNTVIKIADFGMCRPVDDNDIYRQTQEGGVPYRWMAIESLRHGIYSAKSDAWSYGILLWEMLSLGASPFRGVSPNRLEVLLARGHRLKIPGKCPPVLAELINKCWKEKPEDRPTFYQITTVVSGLCECNLTDFNVLSSNAGTAKTATNIETYHVVVHDLQLEEKHYKETAI